MVFCEVVKEDDHQKCIVCGAIYSGEFRVRAVCGIDRSTPVPKGGPGTELKKILARFGIKATVNCKCNTRARAMDDYGVEWCEDNLETIVEWMKEEAANRGVPFVSALARMIVRRAIADAKRSLAP